MQKADFNEKKNEALKKLNIYYYILKMGKEIITFGENEIQKRKFHRYKNPII